MDSVNTRKIEAVDGCLKGFHNLLDRFEVLSSKYWVERNERSLHNYSATEYGEIIRAVDAIVRSYAEDNLYFYMDKGLNSSAPAMSFLLNIAPELKGFVFPAPKIVWNKKEPDNGWNEGGWTVAINQGSYEDFLRDLLVWVLGDTGSIIRFIDKHIHCDSLGFNLHWDVVYFAMRHTIDRFEW